MSEDFGVYDMDADDLQSFAISKAEDCKILESERDLWKSKAGKLAEALNLHMQWVGCPPTGPSDFDSLREDAWNTAKAALAAYDKETQS